MKELRRLGTRYCKLAEGFAVIIMLACWRQCLRHYFSYSA
ncbi:transposase [Pseudomonas mosselii]|nr:transposase [Pseudomonas mosselii]